MNNLSHDQLVSALRAGAEGSYLAESAVELLIAHGTWLRRADFLGRAVEVSPPPTGGDQLLAFVDWPAALASDLPAAASERQMLEIAAEVAGVDSHRSLGDLVTGLDDANVGLVVSAVVRARSGAASRPILVGPLGQPIRVSGAVRTTGPIAASASPTPSEPEL